MGLRFWKRPKVYGCRITLEQLEDRIVLDAAGGASQVDDQHDTAHQTNPDTQQAASQGNTQSAAPPPGGQTAPTQTTAAQPQQTDPITQVFHQDLNVVLVSNDLHEIKGISDAAVQGTKVIVYDAQKDNLHTISGMLDQLVQSTGQKIDNLAVVDAGGNGALKIGADLINSSNITGNSSILQAIGQDLSENAQIHFFASSLAGGEQGQGLVAAIAEFTKADVFASSDATGSSGNWNLEYGSNAAVPMHPVLDSAQLTAVTSASPEGVSLSLSSVSNDPDVHVLVISSDVADADQLAAAAAQGVITVTYDGRNGSPESILQSLEQALQGQKADSIAFATYDLGEGRFHLVSGYSVDADSLLNSPELQHFWQGVGGLLASDGRVDLLACRLASTDAGLSLVSELEHMTGHNVAASDDPTGNAAYGGDWILETHNVDLAVTYFNASSLNDFQGPLDADYYSVPKNGVLNVSAPAVMANDPPVSAPPYSDYADWDPTGATYGYPVGTYPSHGTLTPWVYVYTIGRLNEGFTYTPTPGYSGPDSFTYALCYSDEWGVYPWATYTVYIDVTNSAPAATNMTQTQPYTEGAASVALDDIVVTDPDTGDVITATLTLNNYANAGSLTASSGHGETYNAGVWTVTGSVSNVNLALAAVSFVPNTNYDQDTTITTQVRDQAGTGPTNGTVTLDVTPVNDAPVLMGSNEFAPIYEDPATNPGTLVSFLINGWVSDVDGPGPTGIAVTAVDEAHGQWKYSIDGGTNWLDFDALIGGNHATLLGPGDKIRFEPSLNWNGTANLSYVAWDQTPGYGNLHDTDANATLLGNPHAFSMYSPDAVITVKPANDAPMINLTAVEPDKAINEAFTLNSAHNPISITDDDAGTNDIAVRLTAVNGWITLGGPHTDLTLVDGSWSNAQTMLIKGTKDNINTALANGGLTFMPGMDYVGTSQLLVYASDFGWSGMGGVQTAGAKVDIKFGSPATYETNDFAPVNYLNGNPSFGSVSISVAASTPESPTSWTFEAGGDPPSLISIADADDPGGNASDIFVHLTADHGTITLSQTTGLFLSEGDGENDTRIGMRGTISAINAALNSMVFEPTVDYVGTAKLYVNTSDLGTQGWGTAQYDNDVLTINVTGTLNAAPVIDSITPQATAQNADLTFSLGNGNLVHITDADAGSNEVEVRLTARNGTLDLLGSHTGLTLWGSLWSGVETLRFKGTLADITTALNAGLIYTPTTGFEGYGGLSIVCADQGYSGVGGIKVSTQYVQIEVGNPGSVDPNYAPSITAPYTAYTFDNAAITWSGAAIHFNDSDWWASDTIGVTLRVYHGTLTLTDPTGLYMAHYKGTAEPNGTDDSTLFFSGTVEAVTNALTAGLTYTPDPDYSGPDTLFIAVSDDGNHGKGPAYGDTHNIDIWVHARNDAPTVTVNPAPTGIVEDNPPTTGDVDLTNVFRVQDVDGDALTVTVAATYGYVAAGSIFMTTGGGGASVSDDDPINHAHWTIQGAPTDVNLALATLHEHLPANFNGDIKYTITANDGVAAPVNGSTILAVTAVNDAPTAASFPVTGGEDAFTAINWQDFTDSGDTPPNAGDHITIMSSPANGTLYYDADLNGTWETALGVFSPVPWDHASWGKVAFQPAANWNGATSFTYTVTDNGGTANGGQDTSAAATVSVTITAENDAPTISGPGAQSTNEDTPLVFDGGLDPGHAPLITVGDVDAGTGIIEVVIDVQTGHGIVTLVNTGGLTSLTDNGTYYVVLQGQLSAINNALNGLIFTPDAGYNGSEAGFHIQVDDKGFTGEPGYLVSGVDVNITVNADAPPSVQGFGIPDVTAHEYDPDYVHQGFWFDDAEDGAAALTYTVTGNTNTGLVTPTVVWDSMSHMQKITLDYAPTGSGTADITIRATDTHGQYVEDTFHLTVEGNAAPSVLGFGIPDVTAHEYDPDYVHQGFWFDDAEDGAGALTYTVTGNTNMGLVTPTVVWDSMSHMQKITLDYAAAGSGVADITIRATDTHGQYVEDTFHLTVEGNAVPQVLGIGIPDVTAHEYDPDYVHQGFWFDDAEDGAAALTYTVTGNTNSTLVTPTVVWDSMSHMQKITLDYAPTGSGTADITIRATDTHGQYVEDTFHVTVEGNAAPQVLGFGIPDVTAHEYDPDYVHQGFWFDDAEDGAAALTYTVTGNTNSTLVTPTVVWDSMSHMQKITLDYAPTGSGTADITIRATDTHGQYVEDTFRVTVGGNEPPSVMWGGIPDVTATENDPDYVHQGFWFDDAEDGAGALTYAVTGNTNPGLVTPTVVFDSMSHMQKIKLDYAPTGLGSADIAIRATDTHGLWVEDTFRVTVNAYVQTQTDPSGSPPYVQSYVAPYVPPPTETVLPPVITITPTIDVTPTAPSSLPGQMAVDALTPPMLSQPEQLVAAALPPAVVEMLQAAEAHLAEVQQAAALQAAAEAIKTAEIKAAEVKAGEAVPPPGAVPGEQVVTKDGMPVPKPMKEQGAGEAKVSMEGFAAAGKEGGPAKGPVGPIVVAGKPGVVPGQVPVAVVPQVVVFNMASVSTNDLFTSAKVEVGTTPMGKSGSLGTYLNDSAPPPPVSTVEKAALAQEKAENLMWDNVSKHIHGCTRCSELAGQAVQVFW